MDPEQKTTQYTYDKTNKLVEEILPNNITTKYTYDSVSNLTNMIQTNTDGKLIDEYSYTYDNAGNVLTKSQDGEYTREYTYDQLNRLIGIKAGDEQLRYIYDSIGNRRQQYQQSGEEIQNVLTYDYDIANKLLSFDNEKYKYDKNGNLTEVKRGNKPENQYTYDDQNRMISSENKWGDTSSYTYDFMGNRVTVETSIKTNAGGNRPDPDKEKVKTNNGRGIGVGQIPPGHERRDIDLVNENVDGENTNKAGWGHQYNRTDTRTEYVYDITSQYQNVLMEYGPHYQTQLYTYGVGRIAVDFNELDDSNNGWIPETAPTVHEEAMERLYYIKDELGTTKRLIGEDGKASVSYSYYDFGSPNTTTHFDINWSGPDNLFGYTGYEWDKVAEMWYAKARYYNSDLGRFTAEDPLKGTIGDIQSLNLYPYVVNNPLKYVDLNGRAATDLGNFQSNAGGRYTLSLDKYSYIEDPAGKVYSAWNDTRPDFRIPILKLQGNRDFFGCEFYTRLSYLQDKGIDVTKLEVYQLDEIYEVEHFNKIGMISGGIDAAAAIAINIAKGVLTTSVKISLPDLILDNKQLQKKFKHAIDFGIEGNFNTQNANLFNNAIHKIVSNADKVFKSSYHGEEVFVYLKDGVGVIQKKSGEFISGWKFTQEQIEFHLKNGYRIK